MGKASKRKKMRKQQAQNAETVQEKPEPKLWQRSWFKIALIACLVIALGITAVYLVNTAEDEQALNGVGENEINAEEGEAAAEEGETVANDKENADGKDSELMDKPVVTIEMESGEFIKIELEPGIAPNTVNNFISLIEDGFYDGLIFHRVIPDFMIQGGCPDGTGMGGPGYSIKGEFSSNGFENNLNHKRGVVSMARSGGMPDSAGSQFFIVVKESPHLDGDYAAFGRVIEGMEVADSIVSVDRDASDRPAEDQVMKKVTVDTFGLKYEKPGKIEN